MIPGFIILIIFFIMAAAMMTKRLPTFLALPIMAVLIGTVSAVSNCMPLNAKEGNSLTNFIFQTILTEGSVKLAQAMMYTLFGAVLSQVVLKTGIAEKIIKISAELAGDKKLIIAFFLFLATAVVFTSLTGLGSVIMIGTLALPILIGCGFTPLYAGSVLLFGICLGGIFNAAGWGFFTQVLNIELSVVKDFAVGYGVILTIVAVIFIITENFRDGSRFAWSIDLNEEIKKDVPVPALLTPLIPVLLITIPALKWPIIPAFIFAIIYGAVTTNIKNTIPTLTSSIIDGLKDMAPVIGLFIGIGMVLNAVMDPLTSNIMQKFISAIIPGSNTGYFLFFTVLAPLALYRGPLNLYGLGSGIAALLISTGTLSPVGVLCAFMTTGQIQGVCDPTNTHNVWIAQFTKTTPEELLKKTIPYAWSFVALALIYTVYIKDIKILP